MDEHVDNGPTDPGQTDPLVGELVDWRATAHRVRRSALIIGTLCLAGWLVTGLVRSTGLQVAELGTFLFVGLVAMLAVEFVVVGGSALRGMLKAGEQGERLASQDVMLVPPQLRKRR